MQNLDVISVNLWQILISLCNLLLIFLIFKKFLFIPVKKVVKARQDALDGQYAAAKEAQAKADQNREEWQKQLADAKGQAEEIVQKATRRADLRSEEIVSQARDKAEDIVGEARVQAEREYRKAQSKLKKEIVDVSAELAEKMIGREINPDDHRAMIDSVIAEIGEDNDGDS